MNGDLWVVTAWWTNSSSTITGPFPSSTTADEWAERTLGRNAA